MVLPLHTICAIHVVLRIDEVVLIRMFQHMPALRNNVYSASGQLHTGKDVAAFPSSTGPEQGSTRPEFPVKHLHERDPKKEPKPLSF